MAKVIVTKALRDEILAKFKEQSAEIVALLETLEEQPHKGKAVGHYDTIVIKEVKYNKFRFYFITDGHILKFGTTDELAALIIKFVRMSEKKDQKRTIEEVKRTLQTMGFERPYANTR
jgi:hypothetical protein